MSNKKCNPWETSEGKQVWKTKSQYFVWLRGALRKIWSDYPIRKVWKKEQLRPVTPEEKENKKFHPSTKHVGECHYCKEPMAGSKLECDHLIASDGCYDHETAEKFLWHCGGDHPDNWVLACKPCHKIKSYQEKQGYETFEEAKAMKIVIDFEKKKTVANEIEKRGEVPESNAKLRREQLFKLLLEDL